jgi:hypothetical protein
MTDKDAGTTRITFRVPTTLRGWFEAEARENNESLSDSLRFALESFKAAMDDEEPEGVSDIEEEVIR